MLSLRCRAIIVLLCALMAVPPEVYAFPALCQSASALDKKDKTKENKKKAPKQKDSAKSAKETRPDSSVFLKAELAIPLMLGDSTAIRAAETPDTAMTVVVDENSPYTMDGRRIYNPSPTRAVWLSALFPGLGQIYNRRYWKLPIIVGGFMGLAYATSWNNNQYQDYTQGYRDLLDDDPSTKSYMNFFPPTVDENDLDKSWLQSTLQARKDYYRRNRDLCIICVVGLYLLCMLDAYVDASLAHFDISPDLSMDVQPAVWLAPSKRPAFGLNWALTF